MKAVIDHLDLVPDRIDGLQIDVESIRDPFSAVTFHVIAGLHPLFHCGVVLRWRFRIPRKFSLQRGMDLPLDAG